MSVSDYKVDRLLFMNDWNEQRKQNDEDMKNFKQDQLDTLIDNEQQKEINKITEINNDCD